MAFDDSSSVVLLQAVQLRFVFICTSCPTSWRCVPLRVTRAVRNVATEKRTKRCIPSSSSKMWSRPTFCPRECLALAPQTTALGEANEKMAVGIMTWKNLLFHLLSDLLMNRVAEILNAAFAPPEHNGLSVVWSKSPRFRVNTDKVQCFPHLLDEFIDVKPVFGRYWDRMWNFISVITRVRNIPFGAYCAAQHTEGQALRSRWHRSKVNKVRIWHNLDVTCPNLVQDLNSSIMRGVLQANKYDLRITLECTL